MTARELQIATSSIADGLGFGCNLLLQGLELEVERRPNTAAPLLRSLTQFLSLQYAGEERLALEELQQLARAIGPDISFRREQLASQLAWCATAIGTGP